MTPFRLPLIRFYWQASRNQPLSAINLSGSLTREDSNEDTQFVACLLKLHFSGFHVGKSFFKACRVYLVRLATLDCLIRYG
jgi:hypothetical protein